MLQLTQSLRQYLFQNHRDIVALVMLGHTELVNEEIWNAYIEWCKTDEGRSYLKGGANYREESDLIGGTYQTTYLPTEEDVYGERLVWEKGTKDDHT